MALNIYEQAKGSDGEGLMEGDLTQLHRVRARCMQRVRSMIASSPNVLSKADERAYEEQVFSDEALAKAGKHSVSERIQALQENLDVYLPQMASAAPLLEGKFRGKIEEAIHNKWIGKRSAARWMQRLSAENAFYYQKKVFIETKFPKYLENWSGVAKKRQELLKNPAIKLLRPKDTSKLSIFLQEDDFLNRSYEERKSILTAIDAALIAKDRNMSKLYGQAKSRLESAARKKAMSWNKIGPWLQKIFKNNEKSERIDDFLNNRGSWPLEKLIANWSEASARFAAIEKKRSEKGTPRGFQCVSMEVFLNWEYGKRTAYLEHAEDSLEGVDKEQEILLKIRHELGAQDWEGASELIAQAKKEPMTPEQQKRLQSMENFLRLHGNGKTTPAVKEQKEARSPRQIIGEINAILGADIPPQLQKFYRKSLNRGYQAFWTWTTLMYNRVWCHQHNYLDENKEKDMEKGSKEKTRQRMKEGHSDYGLEANVVKDDTNAEAAIRDQDGIKGAQILFVEEDAHESLTEKVNEHKNNRNFWYWTSVIPEGVKYPQHLYIVQAIHPKLKKLARELEQVGGRFPLSSMDMGPSTTPPAKAPEQKAPVPQFTMAA